MALIYRFFKTGVSHTFSTACVRAGLSVSLWVGLLASAYTSAWSATDTAAQCLQLPEKVQSYGDITKPDFARWMGIDDWQYLTNARYLATGSTANGRQFLEQQFKPSAKGSVRVVGLGHIPPQAGYTLSQAIYLARGFDWGGEDEGGKLGFGLGGNSVPSGGQTRTDGFSARFMWRGNGDGTANLVVYAYTADRQQNLPYGDDYPVGQFQVPIGEWFNVTMEVTINSDNNLADGGLRVWIDDELKLQKNAIQWQSDGPAPVVDRLIYSTFHGGNSETWAPDGTVYARFSDVCWQHNVKDTIAEH